MQNSYLEIKIDQARALPIRNISGECDPFARVSINQEDLYQTNLFLDNRNPPFKEKVTLPIITGKEDIEIKVYDFNPKIKHELIGVLKIDLNSLSDQEIHAETHNLFLDRTRVGSIKLEC